MPHLTLASCLVRKSTKPKPRCDPVPAIFLGSRTVFSSPKVLGMRGQSKGAVRSREEPSFYHKSQHKQLQTRVVGLPALGIAASGVLLCFPLSPMSKGPKASCKTQLGFQGSSFLVANLNTAKNFFNVTAVLLLPFRKLAETKDPAISCSGW